MSGHSKWSTIKRKKAATDARRGMIFAKLIKEISIAARQGGGDENAHPRLRQAVAAAKAANMPGDNIKRAIQKGTGQLEGVQYEEATYEGYGPGGVAIYMEVLTDNKKRTVAEIRHLMTKYGGHLGENGSVAWMFDKQGQITVPKTAAQEDTLFKLALESGASDFSTEDEDYLITTTPGDLVEITEKIKASGIPVATTAVEMVPQNILRVEREEAPALMNLMEALEDCDDIQNIYSNLDVDEDLL